MADRSTSFNPWLQINSNFLFVEFKKNVYIASSIFLKYANPTYHIF